MPCRLRDSLAVCTLATAVTAHALADDLLVPGTYPTIQAAVDAAVDGDVVVLAEGFYSGTGNLEVRIEGKRITIRGEAPTGSVIYGRGDPFEDQRRAMRITGSGTEVTLQDLEITGCTGEDAGGAVRVSLATVLFERVAFTENEAVGDFSGEGGAISLASADATFRDCTFRGNGAWAFGGRGSGDGEGGAVRIRGGRAVFERCVFEDNSASGSDQFGSARGGAIRASETTLTLRGCVLDSNRAYAASASGGGISSGGSTLRLIGTHLVSNRATSFEGGAAGGGISATGNTTIVGGSFRSNSARDEVSLFATGGGFRLRDTTHMTNVIVTGNSVSGGEAIAGAGALGGDATVTNCTVTGNSGSTVSGLVIFESAAVAIHNSIVRDGVRTLRVGSGAMLAITYSNVEGGYAGPGNIDVEPLLNPDLGLVAGSPCIDAGDSTALPADAFDLDGDGDTIEPLPLDHFGGPRRVDDPATPDTGVGSPVVDMGASEFAPCRADIDGDGVLTVADFAAFQNLFAAGDPIADFDGDGALTIFDFLAFQNAFDAGCP